MNDLKRKRPVRHLTAAEFKTILPFLRISESRIEAARLVLVDGKTMTEIAEEYGCTKQNVHSMVNHVWKAWERYQTAQMAAAEQKSLPPGWRRVTIEAPEWLLDKFQDEINQVKR